MPTYLSLGDRPSTPTGLFHFGGDLRDLLGVGIGHYCGCLGCICTVRFTVNPLSTCQQVHIE